MVSPRVGAVGSSLDAGSNRLVLAVRQCCTLRGRAVVAIVRGRDRARVEALMAYSIANNPLVRAGPVRDSVPDLSPICRNRAVYSSING